MKPAVVYTGLAIIGVVTILNLVITAKIGMGLQSAQDKIEDLQRGAGGAINFVGHLFGG